LETESLSCREVIQQEMSLHGMRSQELTNLAVDEFEQKWENSVA
jgi:hypothetical protein